MLSISFVSLFILSINLNQPPTASSAVQKTIQDEIDATANRLNLNKQLRKKRKCRCTSSTGNIDVLLLPPSNWVTHLSNIQMQKCRHTALREMEESIHYTYYLFKANTSFSYFFACSSPSIGSASMRFSRTTNKSLIGKSRCRFLFPRFRLLRLVRVLSFSIVPPAINRNMYWKMFMNCRVRKYTFP